MAQPGFLIVGDATTISKQFRGHGPPEFFFVYHKSHCILTVDPVKN